MTWVEMLAQKCDTFRDMDGEEGPVEETAWGTEGLPEPTVSRDSGPCRRGGDTAGQPRSSTVPCKRESTLLPALTSPQAF